MGRCRELRLYRVCVAATGHRFGAGWWRRPCETRVLAVPMPTGKSNQGQRAEVEQSHSCYFLHGSSYLQLPLTNSKGF